MFKTETHLHVKEASRCSRLYAADMMQLYADAGYDTVFVTDHFMSDYFPTERAMSWEEKVDSVYQGYLAAKAAGEALGLTVLFGVEVSLDTCPNHYLLYGVTREIMLRLPDLFAMTPETLYAFCRANGVTMVQAHPYRDEVCYPTPECVDAVEVNNPNPRHENYDAKAIALAKEWNLPMTSGSDAHRVEDVAGGGVETNEKIETAEDYVRLLRQGALVRRGEKL